MRRAASSAPRWAPHSTTAAAGWKIGVEPRDAGKLVERLRAGRPEESFTISLRVPFDARAEAATLRASCDEYETAGVQHLHYVPDRGDLDAWLPRWSSWQVTSIGALTSAGPCRREHARAPLAEWAASRRAGGGGQATGG